MRLPVGVDIRADGAQAIGTINRIAGALENMARNPATLANNAMSRFQKKGSEATSSIMAGFREAEGAWYRLGGALGVPMSMAGIVGAISGVRSLKDVLITANSQLETSRVRMSAMMKDFNDTPFSARAKSKAVIKDLRQYAVDTPFEFGQLMEAATTASSVTKSPAAVMQITKYAAKLAALRGTTDVGWSAQALVGALNGNTTSLKESFGINVSESVLQNMSMMMGFGPNSPQGRLMALQRMIDQKAGKGEGIVRDLAKTGAGAVNTLKDALTLPITDAFTPAYDRMVTALVRFNDAYGKFIKTEGFRKLQAALTDRFMVVGQGVARVLDTITDNLDNIPAIMEKYGPTISLIGKFAGGLLAINAAGLVVKGTLGLALGIFQRAGKMLSPITMMVTNPALVAGLLALSAVMWPTARSLEIGGKSLDKWLEGVEKWAGEKDWRGIFLKPLNALKKLLSGDYLVDGRFQFQQAITDAFGDDSLAGRIARNIVRPIALGFRDALFEAFPGLTPLIEKFGNAWDNLRDKLGPHMGLIGKVATGLGALALAGRVLGLAAPLLTGGAFALRGVAVGIGLLYASLANPLIAGGLIAITAALYPFIKGLDVGGRSIDGWLEHFGKLSGDMDWEGIFAGGLKAVRGFLGSFMDQAGKFDAGEFWKNLIAPDSLFARMGDIVSPIWQGFIRALDDTFPELGGVGKLLGTVSAFLGGALSGFLQTAGPTLKLLWDAAVALGNVAWPMLTATFQAISQITGIEGARAWGEVIGKAAGIFLPILGAWKLLVGGGAMLARMAAPAIRSGGRALGMGRAAINWAALARLEILTHPAGMLAGIRTVITTMTGGFGRALVQVGAIGARMATWVSLARLEILTNPAGMLAGIRTVITTMTGGFGRALLQVGAIGARIGGWVGMARLQILTHPLGVMRGILTVITTQMGGFSRLVLRVAAGWRTVVSFVTRIPGFMGVALTAVRGVATAALAIGRGFLVAMGPVGWIILGVTTLVMAGVELYKRWTPFRELVNSIWVSIKRLPGQTAAVGASISGGVTRAWQQFMDGVAQAKAWFGHLGTLATAFGASIRQRVVNYWNDLKAGIQVVRTTLAGYPALIGTVGQTIRNRLLNYWNDLKAGMFGVRNYLSGFPALLGNMGRVIKDKLSAVWDTFTTSVTTLTTKIGNFITSLPKAIGGFISSIPERFSKMWDKAPAPLRAAFEWMQERAGRDREEARTELDGAEDGAGGGGERYTPMFDGGSGGGGGTPISIARIEVQVPIYAQAGVSLDEARLRAILAEMLPRELTASIEAALSGVRR